MRATVLLLAAPLFAACAEEPDFDTAYAERQAEMEADGARIEAQVESQIAAARQAEAARLETQGAGDGE